jgi:hypothetical protein
MRTIPKHLKLVFKQNPGRSDIYDLTGTKFNQFSFVRLSAPRSEFLIRQGAKYVLESWSHGHKPLFTGLRQFQDRLYYGDHMHNGKRSLMIVEMNPGELLIYLFKTYPRGKRLYHLFRMLPDTLNPRNHPGVIMSPTNPATGSDSSVKIHNYTV